MQPTILIVGASVAGMSAASALRRAGWEGNVAVIDRQPHFPYDRPPLSKQFGAGEWDSSRLELLSDARISQLGIKLILGRRVLRLDERDTVLLDNHQTLAFAGLIAATGAEPRLLSALPLGPRVIALRTLDDAIRLRDAVKRGGQLLIVGGGFIGLEVAAVASRCGLSVSVIEVEPLPLARVVGTEVAHHVRELHAAHGTRFFCGRRVTSALDTATRLEVELDDGSDLSADFAVVGVGVAPAANWLRDSGVTIHNGVHCDSFLATTRRRVYAAGDLASWDNPTFGDRMRIEHWTTAREQGSWAASNLVAELAAQPDQRRPFAHVPYAWSDQYDDKVQIVGKTSALDDITIVRREGRELVATYHHDRRLCGAVCVNSPKEAVRYRKELLASHLHRQPRHKVTPGGKR